MTDATQGSTTTATTEPTLNARVAYAFCKFSGGFWRGPTAARAWGLTLGLALCLAASTAVTVALNQWNRSFFDALETKNVSAFSQATITVAVIVALMAAVGVGIVLTRETLQVRWREWLIDQLLKRWLGERRRRTRDVVSASGEAECPADQALGSKLVHRVVVRFFYPQRNRCKKSLCLHAFHKL